MTSVSKYTLGWRVPLDGEACIHKNRTKNWQEKHFRPDKRGYGIDKGCFEI